MTTTKAAMTRRAIALSLALVMAAQPLALAQSATPQPAANTSAPTPPPRDASKWRVPLVVGGLGVGLGLIGYAGSKALSSKSPWTWQGTSLAAAGGVGGMLAGALIGGLATAGILALTNNNGDLASIGWALLGLGTGALLGGLLGGAFAGKAGDRLAAKRSARRGSWSPSAPSTASASSTGGAGPGGLSGALGGTAVIP
jgi:hypothetical protein